MQVKTKQSYAPFGSVSNKKDKKKKNPLVAPGPGSYDIHLPLITPIVQTIRKKNNNIIVKLGHLGTSSFLGKSQRFIEQQHQLDLGPGQYSPKDQRDLSKQHSPKQKRKSAALKLQQLIKSPAQRHPTITEVKRIDFEEDFEMPNKYDHVSSRAKEHYEKRGSIWSRMTQERNPSDYKSYQNLGPGSYNMPNQKINKSLERKPSSSFVSNSVRSFFDQIRFETNHDDKARKREQRNYKSDLAGPGSYEISPNRKRSLNLYQFFGSTEQRL